MTAYGRTESLDIDRRHPTQSSQTGMVKAVIPYSTNLSRMNSPKDLNALGSL